MTRFGRPIIAATVVAVIAVIIVLLGSAPPRVAEPSAAPTDNWAECTPNAALACTTFQGVPLGPFRSAMSLDTPACDDCTDLYGAAQSAIEREDYPPVTRIDVFDPDPYVLCREIGAACGGLPVGIFVVTFADDTTVPIIVQCPRTIGSVCQRVDHYGPPYS